MEYPKRLVEAEARSKSAIRKENTHVGCPEELHRTPTKHWRTSETPPEGWQTGQDPRTTRNYASSVRTQESERTRHFRTRTLRIEIQSVKGRDGQTPTRRQGDIHAKRKGRCQEQRPYCYARNQKPRPHPRERSEHLNGHQQPVPGSLTSGRAASKPPMRGRPTHENAQVKNITARPPKQTNPQGRARGNRARRRRAKTHSFVG